MCKTKPIFECASIELLCFSSYEIDYRCVAESNRTINLKMELMIWWLNVAVLKQINQKSWFSYPWIEFSINHPLFQSSKYFLRIKKLNSFANHPENDFIVLIFRIFFFFFIFQSAILLDGSLVWFDNGGYSCSGRQNQRGIGSAASAGWCAWNACWINNIQPASPNPNVSIRNAMRKNKKKMCVFHEKKIDGSWTNVELKIIKK